MTDDEKEVVKEFINRRRRQIVFHSIAYYRFGANLISDDQWDVWANELVVCQNKHPELSNQVEYMRDIFKDWDGITGYDLYDGKIVLTVQRMILNN